MTGYGYTPREHNAQARRNRQLTGASVFAFSASMSVMFALIVPTLPDPSTGPIIVLTMMREPAMQFFPLPTLYGALLAVTGWKWLYSLGQYIVCAAITICLMVLIYVATMT